MSHRGYVVLFCGTPYSVPAVTEADCLRIGLTDSNDLFNATVTHLVLLLHNTETKSACCLGNSRETSSCHLNDAIGKHRVFLATAVFLRAAGFFACVLAGHGKELTARTQWTENAP